MSPARGLRLMAAELALFAVTATVAVGFGRLFDDSGGWLAPLLLTAALAHAAGALLRRLGVGVVLQLAAVGLATTLVIAWIHAPDTLRYLLPTSETLRVVGGALDEALMLYPEARAPTEPITGFVIAAMIGVAVVATMSDIAAFRLGAEIQALVPPLTAFVFCSVLGAGDGRITATISFTVFAMGFVLVVRALTRTSATTWLPGDDDRGPVTLVRLGGSLTAVAALAAVLVGPSLPGAGEEGLWTWRGGGGDGSRIVVNPLVDIRSRLVNQSSEVAFTVESSEPSYWRTMALDDFDGQTFTLETTFRAVSGRLRRGGGALGPVTSVEQHFEIGALASPYLPAAYQATSIDTGEEEIRWDDRTSTALLEREEGAYEGLEYRVESLVGTYDPEDLRAAPADVPASIAARYLELPEIDPRVVELAESVVAEADTPYDRALALQDFLREEFEYSVEVQPGHSDSELVRFLIEDRLGYCEQFAASFAAMARVAGLPSRVAVGFTVGEQSPTDPDRYVVRGEHAHAWPEVWFQGVGWVPFEPTPGRGDPRSERHTGVAADQEGGFGGPSTTTTTEAEQGPTPTLDDTLPDVFGDLSGDASASSGDSGGGLPTPLIAIAAAAVVLGGWATLVASAVAVRRWARRRRLGTDPAGQVLASWAEVVDAGRAIALRPAPTETHREFATRLATQVRAADSPLRTLAETASTARFAPDLVLGDEASHARGAAHLAIGAIQASRSRARRVLDRLDPRRALPNRRRTRVRRHTVLTGWAR